jgi:hypothetical protein
MSSVGHAARATDKHYGATVLMPVRLSAQNRAMQSAGASLRAAVAAHTVPAAHECTG